MARSLTGWRRGGDAGRKPRERVTPAPDPQPDPEELRRKALAEKAADFDAVRAAVDDAGGFVRGLWVTFVTLGTYLVIAAGSVTHKQLFLETPIKLPLLDVELPLVAFFVIAPWFFVVFHFYLLLQLALLSEKIASYNRLLDEAFPADAAKSEDARHLRRQLPNDILVQFLAGPRGKGEGAVRLMLWLVAWVTIVIGPFVVLMALQYRFLPYQEERVTWVHRGTLIVDLALLWWLWPSVVVGGGEWRPRDSWLRTSIGVAFASVASLAVLAASGLALTFPREGMDKTWLAQKFHETMTWPLPREPDDKTPDPSWLRARFGNWVEWPDDDTRRGLLKVLKSGTGYWLESVPEARRVIPGTLRLANESFVDEDKLQGMEERDEKAGRPPWGGARTLRTGPRNLVAADLSYVNLSRADLRGVTLDDASLTGAQLVATRADGADTSLKRTSLFLAHLQGAFLDKTQLQGASLFGAELQGAWLTGAQLQGASLAAAQLQGAWLNKAQLQGASLEASLEYAELQGASLDGAQLQGASLEYAELQGASLVESQLQGASFNSAQLQGASLNNAQLQGASISDAFVFRASGAQANLEPIVARVNADPKFVSDNRKEEDLTDKIVSQWNTDATKYVADADRKRSIDQRLARLNANGLAPEEDTKISAFWANLNKRPFDAVGYDRSIAYLACAGSYSFDHDAPYLARGLMRNGVLRLTTDGLPAIAARMRSGREKIENCRGVEGFTDEDWAELDNLSPPPK